MKDMLGDLGEPFNSLFGILCDLGQQGLQLHDHFQLPFRDSLVNVTFGRAYLSELSTPFSGF